MVSLKTIAERCGVSTATVSKALNDHKDISEETKNRVKQTAQTLGYFPNAAARALKTNRSYNIGVLFEEEAGRGLTHEYFSGVLNGLKIQAEKLGYDITFINTCFENRKMSYYEHCRYRNFEGVVIVCANFDDPDVTELIRGKTGRVYGDLNTLLVMMKGIPLAYDKDMQEDKEAVFDAVDTLELCLKTITPMLATMTPLPANMRRAAAKGFINATDCADYLTKKGMPFREAYMIVGRLVNLCIKTGDTLDTLALKDFRAISSLLMVSTVPSRAVFSPNTTF